MPDLLAPTIAVNRFGLGARPGDLVVVQGRERDWLRAQLKAIPPPAPARLPGTLDQLQVMAEAAAERGTTGKKQVGTNRRFTDNLAAETAARVGQLASTEAPLFERLLAFWANHFAVSADSPLALPLAGAYVREALRPQLLGSFAHLLLAAERHPAMLRYLNNNVSIGPGSANGRASGAADGERRRGLNENLAREILELHTLGVDGGYTQDDILELARALTGWTLWRPLQDPAHAGRDAFGFVFRERTHEPGERTLLGKRYAEGGAEQAERMLRDLALHPATARHLARKLARHFVADEPAPALVERLARAYLDGGGELVPLYRALIDAPEAWAPAAAKFKRPEEWLVSALRATRSPPPADGAALMQLLERLGQRPFSPGSPAGFADTAADWIGPDGLWKRIQVAEELADRMTPPIDAPVLARAALGAMLADDTAEQVARAESPQQGVAVLLACPEFQWR